MKIDRFLVAIGEASDWQEVELFKDDVEPEIFSFVKSFYTQTGSLPEFQLLKERFAELPTPTSTPLAFYKQEKEREIFVEKATPILEEFNREQKEDLEGAILKLRARLQEVERPKDLCAHSLKSEVKQRLDFYQQSAPARLRTGISSLDEVTGGLEQDEFFVISARLGIGKSWIGQFIAANVAKQGKTVLFYSGEMTKEQVGSRIDTIWAQGKISNFLYTRNRLTEEEKEKVISSAQQVEGDILIFTPKDLPTSQCRPSDLERLISAYNPDVLVVDQLSLMEPDGGKRLSSEPERRAELSYQLKMLQGKHIMPFILISQLNRGAQNEEATAANLAGSDRIGQDASLIVALKRREDRLRMTVLKARSFAQTDSPMEFTWNVDRGQLDPALSGMDAVRARANQAAQQDQAQQRTTEENLEDWED